MTVAGVGGPYFGRVSEVSSNDLASFLPKNAEATKVNDYLTRFRDSKTIPLIAVFYTKDNTVLTSEQTRSLQAVKDSLASLDAVEGEVSPALIAEDGKAAILVLPLSSDAEYKTIFPALRETISDKQLTVDYKFAGPASFARDLQSGFGAIDVTLLLVALGVVFVILLIVYRSPLLPILVLIGSMGALTASIVLVWHLAKASVVQLNGQTQGILFILVIGAATDYSLLYIARLREEYHNHTSKWLATKAALKGSFEPIIAAGGTVIVGLMCLLLSDLGSNKALGPVGSIGVALAIVSSLTFLPAMLYLVGRRAFWPNVPAYDRTHLETYASRHRMWAAVGRFVERFPRPIWIVSGGVLLLLSAGFFQLKATGVPQSDLVLGASEARDAQKILDVHFPAGSGSPTYIISTPSAVDAIVGALDADAGVSSVAITAQNTASGTRPVGTSQQELLRKIETGVRAQLAQDPSFAYLDEAQQRAMIQAVVASANPFASAQDKVIDGKVLLQATLVDEADSQAARATVLRMREAVKKIDQGAMVGGTTAVQYDTNVASLHDRALIIPVILVAITLILIMLLRSIVAPLVLLATTVISFGATLGVSALLFNHVLHFPGADPSVVLFGFVFLVALGIDYNIFLMTRVREETLLHGVRKGTIKGLVVTGGVITSAGIVLAATFAALGVIPILFLAQLAFIVAFGVLLDKIVVRSLLVPALTLEIGKKMWWPTKVKANRKT